MPPGQELVQEQLRRDKIVAKKSIRHSKILITRQTMMEKSNQIKRESLAALALAQYKTKAEGLSLVDLTTKNREQNSALE